MPRVEFSLSYCCLSRLSCMQSPWYFLKRLFNIFRPPSSLSSLYAAINVLSPHEALRTRLAIVSLTCFANRISRATGSYSLARRPSRKREFGQTRIVGWFLHVQEFLGPIIACKVSVNSSSYIGWVAGGYIIIIFMAIVPIIMSSADSAESTRDASLLRTRVWRVRLRLIRLLVKHWTLWASGSQPTRWLDVLLRSNAHSSRY